MLILFLYVIWSISYLIISIIFKVFFLKKLLNQKSIIVNMLLIFYFNKNLSFYKNEISNIEYQNIISHRHVRYPMLAIIHDKINTIFNITPINNTTFKENFYIYKFLQKKNLINILDYSLQQNILKSTLKYNYSGFLLGIYILYKNSLSHETMNIDMFNSLLLNDTKYKNNLNMDNKTNNVLLFKKKFINILFYLNKIVNIGTNNINVNQNFMNQILSKFLINFSASNIIKYLSDLSISKSTILFLRKNKIFNKSRYSRNRQTYRTGAYWCLYVNIIAVIAFYFWFYNFTMNFSYIWWLLYSFILSFFFFKAIKFNLYNPITLKIEMVLTIKWLYYLINSSIQQILNLINLYFLNQKLIFITNSIVKNKNNAFFKYLLKCVFWLNDYIYNKLYQ